ncbi:MAG: hypothetical protein ABWZ40_04925 [Caulobacterales bacterium]
MKFRLGWTWSAVRLAAASALFLIAGAGTSWAKDGCAFADSSLPSSKDALAQMAGDCERAAATLGLSVDQATAAYNSARAYNALAATWGNNSQSFDAYNKAKTQIDRSLILVSNDSLAQLQGKKATAAKALRIGRSLEKARAVMGLGQSSLPQGAACASNAACQTSLSLALNEMSSVGAAPVESDPQFVDYYFLRASIYSSLGQPASARQDLMKIAGRSDAAKTQLVKYYSDEVDAALRAQPANPDRIRSVIATYPQTVDYYPEIQARLGSAYLKLAQLEKVGALENYRLADTVFQKAIVSAGKANNIALQADAYQGRGEALLGLGNVAEAIVAFQKSSSLEPNEVERKIALGMAYARAGYWAQAETQLDGAVPKLALWKGSKSDLTDALIKRAEVKRELHRSAADVRAAYQEAVKWDPTSAKPKLGVGKSLFDDGRYGEAEPYFNDAIVRGSSLPSADLATAYYYRSLLRAKAAMGAAKPNWPAVLDDADSAVRLGGSSSPYKEQACLVRIVSSLKGSSGFCSGNYTPEGSLLQGMSYLRAAQGAPAVQRSSSFDLAEQAFGQGLYAVQQTGSFDVRPSFATLSGQPPSVRVLLEYGKAKVTSCFGRPVDTPLTQSELASATRFFADHRVDACK